MMMYSVWNQGAGRYDYFETPAEQASLNVEKPDHLVSRTLGSTIDQAAWPLPGNAVHVGGGPDAIGRVAVRKSLALAGDTGGSSPLVKAGLLVGAAVLLWKYAVKSRRRRHS